MENNKREREETKDYDEDVLYPWAKKKPRHMRLISGRNRTVMQEALTQFEIISKQKPILYLLLSIDNWRSSRYLPDVYPKHPYGPKMLSFLLDFPKTDIQSVVLQTETMSPVDRESFYSRFCSLDTITLLPDFTYMAEMRIHYLSFDEHVWFGNTVEQEDVFLPLKATSVASKLVCGGMSEWQESEKARYREVTRQVYAADTPLTEDVLMCILSYLVYD